MQLPRSRFLAGTSGVLGAFAFTGSPVRAAQFEYRLADPLPPEMAASVRLVQMSTAIRQETQGRLDIKVFPNAILGSQSSILTQLRTGAVQFVLALDVSYAGVVPAVAVSGVGFAFPTVDKVYAALDGNLGAYIVKEFAAKGIHCFEKMWTGGFREVTSYPHPIRTADDFAGFRIRTPPAQIVVDLFKTLGAAPNPIDSNEMYTALQTHLVDGQEAPYDAIEAFKIYEVTRYVSNTNHMWAGHWLTANVDAWNALPPDIQAVVRRNVVKYTLMQRHDALLQNRAMGDKLQRQGMKFNSVDGASMRTHLGPFYGRWKNEFGATVWGLLEEQAGRLA